MNRIVMAGLVLLGGCMATVPEPPPPSPDFVRVQQLGDSWVLTQGSKRVQCWKLGESITCR